MQIPEIMYLRDRVYSTKKDHKLGKIHPSSLLFFISSPPSVPPSFLSFLEKGSHSSAQATPRLVSSNAPSYSIPNKDFRCAPSWPAPVNSSLKLRILECKNK